MKTLTQTITTNINDLNSIEKLEALGFEGSDACLETSLYEYGLIWLKGETETLFIYGVSIDGKQDDYGMGENDYSTFDRCTVANDCNVKEEYDWADFTELYDNGNSIDIERNISELLNEYGYENIFGAQYTEGFKVSTNI